MTETLEAKLQELETAQHEAQLFYQISQQLNTVQNETELLAMLANPGVTTQPTWVALYRVIDADSNGLPTWGEVAAMWAANDAPPLPAGMRFFVPQFPFTTTWAQHPHQPLFVTDILRDDRFAKDIRATLTQSLSRALAIIPLAQAGRWVGFFSLSWDKPHEFSAPELAAYHAIQQMAAPIVESQHLRNQQQDTHANTLFQISSRLNAAADAEELLKALTQPGQTSGVALSALAYIDADAADQPAWTELVSTWQQEGTRTTTDLVAAIWSQIIATSQKEGKLPVSTGARYHLNEFPFTPLWLTSQTEPQLIANAATDFRLSPTIKQVLAQVGIQATAVIPLALNGRWLGVISLFWQQAHAFNETEIALYRAFTTLAAPTVYKQRQIQQLSKLAAEQTSQANRFRTLTQNTTAAIAVCNLAGHYIFANEAYSRLLAAPLADLPGAHLAGFLPEAAGITNPADFSPELTDTVQEILAGFSGEKILRQQDGRTFQAHLTTFILKNEANQPENLAILLQNLTHAKQVDAWPGIQRQLVQDLAAGPDNALELCLQAAAQASTLERGRLYLADDSGALNLAAHCGLTADQLETLRQFEADTAVVATLTAGQPQYCGLAELACAPGLQAGDPAAQAVAVTPVFQHQKLRGVLHLASANLEQTPPFAPIPLETIAVYIANTLAQQQAQTELAAAQTAVELKLKDSQAQILAALATASQQLGDNLRAGQTQMGLNLQATRAQLEAELQTTRAQAEAALRTLQQRLAAAGQELEATRARLETELETTRASAQAELETTRANAQAELESSRTTTLAALAAVETKARAELAEKNTQADAQLNQTRRNLADQLQELTTQTQTHLQATQTEAETALRQVISAAQTQLQATQTQAETELTQAQTEAGNQLAASQTHLEAALQQISEQAQAELEQTRAQAETDLLALQQAKAQAEADLAAELEQTRAQAEADLLALQQAKTQSEANFTAELEQTWAEAESALLALRQAKAQSEANLAAELEQTRRQAQAALQTAQNQAQVDLQVARKQAEVELQAAQNQAKTNLETAHQQAQLQLQAAQNQAQADLLSLGAQAKNQLDATQSQAQSELQAVRLNTEQMLRQQQAVLGGYLQNMRVQFETVLDQTRQHTETELAATRSEAEISLRYSEARYRTLLNSISNWIFTVDLNGYITGTNLATEALLGYPPAQLGGQSFLALVAPAQRHQIQARFQQALKEQGGWAETITWLRPDEAAVTCQCQFSPVRNQQGQLVGFNAINHNLTHRQQAQTWLTEQRRLAQLLAATPPLGEALVHSLAAAVQATGLNRGRLYFIDQESNQIKLVAQQNMPGELDGQIAAFSPAQPEARCLRSESPIYANAAETADNPAFAAGDSAARSVAIVPVYNQERQIAALHLASTTLEQVPELAPVALETIAAHIAGLVARNQLDADLHQTKIIAEVQLEETGQQAQAQLDALRQHITHNMAALQAEADAALQATRANTTDHLAAAAIAAAAELRQTRLEAEAKLQHAEAELRQAKAEAENELRQTRADAIAELQQIRAEADARLQHAEAELRQAEAEAEAKLQHAKDEFRHAKAEAEAKLQHAKDELHQAKAEADTALQTANAVAVAELQQAKTAAESLLRQTKTDADTVLQTANAVAAAELQQTKTAAEDELRQTQAAAEAALQTANAMAAAELQQTKAAADAALDYSQSQLRQLFTSVSDWVWSVDTDGKLIASNPVVSRLLGYAPAELVGVSIFDLIQPDSRTQVQSKFVQLIVEQVNENSGWRELTIPWRHKDGSVRYGQSTLRPMLDAKGFLHGFQGIDQDITNLCHVEAERSALTEQLKIANAVAEQVNAIHAPAKLQSEVTALLQNQLNLYHVQFFRFDPAGGDLALQAVAGEAAEFLQAEGQRIPLDLKRSLTARAARTWEIALSNDVKHDPNFNPHPLLPDTRAALNVPLIAQKTLWGVLDFQHNQPNRFKESDVNLLNTVAGYLAAALANLHLQEKQKEAEQQRVALEKRIIEVQEEAIQTLPTPIIPMMGQMIAVPLIGKIDAVRAKRITQTLLNGINEHRAKIVMLDVSGIPAIDSQVTDHLNKIVQAAQLKGVQTMLTGMPDTLAETVGS